MRLLKKLTATAVATAAIGTAFATAAPAYAAGGTAPSCIVRSVHNDQDGFSVILVNKCGRTMRVQVVVSYAPDGPCYTMAAGAQEYYRYDGTWGLYDRTAVC
ncbi:beta-Ig-H3/fasciclin [Streptomyces sp. NPDC048604]|uniref:beta-Ig-H3/fasciclin n=1 Tax=Streptomyces sp. NPDC048604 TaxID=3365578 RepID=UPI00371242B3